MAATVSFDTAAHERVPPEVVGRSALDVLLAELVDDGRVIHVERSPARPARTAQLTAALPEAIATRCPPTLWSHQAAAVDLVRAG